VQCGQRGGHERVDVVVVCGGGSVKEGVGMC